MIFSVLTSYVSHLFKCWFCDENGMAAVEAAMVFPMLLTLVLGTYDLGNGILANQKAVRASQVTADLISRNSEVDTAMIDEAITGGELALNPFPIDTYGVDIVSISFDENANAVIEWRETRNMPPIPDVLTRVANIAEAGEGVLVVSIQYDFEPLFAGFIVNTIPMREIAFSRGRNSPVVERI